MSITSFPRHVRSLDGLRAVASLLVVGTHVGFWTGLVTPSVVGAVVARLDIGVALFFALSGYLLTRPWLTSALDHARRAPDLRVYAVRRFARIAPAYWCALAAVLAIEYSRLLRPELRSDAMLSPEVVGTHAVIMQDLTGEHISSFSQTWSLTTEVTFYAVLPLLGALLLRRTARLAGTDEKFTAISRMCGAAVLIGLAVTAYSTTDLPFASGSLGTSLLGHLGWFAFGAWVCVYRLADRSPRLISRMGPDALIATALVCFLVAASPIGGNLLFETPHMWQAATREILYGIVAALALLAATHRGEGASLTSRALTHPALVWIGDRSYGLFLWHMPILFVVLTVLGGPLFERSPLLVGSLTLGLSLVVADLSYRWVERPVLAWAHRRTQLTHQ